MSAAEVGREIQGWFGLILFILSLPSAVYTTYRLKRNFQKHYMEKRHPFISLLLYVISLMVALSYALTYYHFYIQLYQTHDTHIFGVCGNM